MNKIYYPESKIKRNQYTAGKQYMTQDFKEYVGYYDLYDDGIVTISGTTTELQKFEVSAILTVYDNLKERKQFTSPKPVYRVVTNEEFQEGTMTRYFIKRRNSFNPSDIMEIDEQQYNSWQEADQGIDERLYVATQLTWKLTGPVQDSIVDNIKVAGVQDTNKRTVYLVDETFQGIVKYLTDYLELTVYSINTRNSFVN